MNAADYRDIITAILHHALTAARRIELIDALRADGFELAQYRDGVTPPPSAPANMSDEVIDKRIEAFFAKHYKDLLGEAKERLGESIRGAGVKAIHDALAGLRLYVGEDSGTVSVTFNNHANEPECPAVDIVRAGLAALAEVP